MIAFSCTHCGGKLRITDQFAGKRGKCPLCKQMFLVPSADTDETIAPPPAIAGSLSSLASAGISGGVTLDHQPGDDSPAAAGKKQRRALRDIVDRNANGKQRYIIEDEIARGGMGAVLRAVDCDIRREVAVKYMLKTDANASQKTRFIEEAQITGQLEHPNIVPIHELGVDAEKRIFFSMKMVKGRSLAQIIKSLSGESPASTGEPPALAGGEEYTLNRLLTIFDKICNALAYAHSRGVIHRDLKPANIMVGDFGEVYVMDWGLAKVLNKADTAITPANPFDFSMPLPPVAAPTASASGSQKVVTSREGDADLTQDGAVLGTPVYMPPEQASGELKEIDERSDIYSLGAILYELLTLQPPIDKAGGFLAILMRVGLGEIALPAERAPERARSGKIPPELSAVAMKALAKEKAKRYQSITELQRDIQLFQEGRSVSAKQDSAWEMFQKLVKRNKGASTGVGLALAVLLGSLVFIAQAYHAYRQEQDARRQGLKKSVPAFLAAADFSIEQKKLAQALAQLDVVLEYEPDNPEALLRKGQVLIAQRQFASARPWLDKYLVRTPADADARELTELCVQARADDAATAAGFGQILSRQKQFALAAVMFQDREKLLHFYRGRLEAAEKGLGRYLTLDANGHFVLRLHQIHTPNTLNALRGIPVNHLTLHGIPKLTELAPLQGMPLHSLSLSGSDVTDLTPLRGMPLKTIRFSYCPQLKDLGPLAGMKIEHGSFDFCRNVDYAALKGMPLKSLTIDQHSARIHFSILKGMPLKNLRLHSGLGDFGLLQGMPLEVLVLLSSSTRTLEPVRGMPLKILQVPSRAVTDVMPLEGMQMERLVLTSLANEGVKGIEVVRNMESLLEIGLTTQTVMSAQEFWRKYDAGEFKTKSVK